MRLFILFLAALVAVRGDQTLTYTQESCQTTLGSISQSKVPTTTMASTISVTFPVHRTFTPTSTVIPAPVTVSTTSTSTVTVFSSTQTTDMATATVTNTESDTVTQSTTSTVTTTTTLYSMYTVTIVSATVSGFTAISQESSYVARGLQQRGEPLFSKRHSRGQSKITGESCRNPSSRKPQKVTCKEAVEKVILHTITKTASPVTKTAAPSTKTITATPTTTVTDVSTLADTTTTTTTTTTATVMPTVTSTATITTTFTTATEIPVATTTVYSACASNNFIQSANGNQPIYEIASSNLIDSSQADQYACCNACQSSTNCGGFAFYTGPAYCFFLTSDSCNAANTMLGSFSTSPDVSGKFTIGNGPCGQIYNDGSIG